jgi:hypothetical protein
LPPLFNWGGLNTLRWYLYSNSARKLSEAIVRSRTDPTINIGLGMDLFLGYADETTAGNDFATDYGPLPRATLAFLGLPQDGMRCYSTDPHPPSPPPTPVTTSLLGLPLVAVTCEEHALILVFGSAHAFRVSIRHRPQRDRAGSRRSSRLHHRED